ncbi:hypothetical protein AK812_SmicGene6627 [Symbiodinium microadriaticum]|uniref:Uncharacterized protein n=1 Tax=Symbiodinium microadriaticum TaxID=2951 RepID=A0A1Q9EQQ0_SYMMI|nr:hypothetical protein AK812_SmicGene6627 [Symbiodinium microadriaticum]
MVLVPAPAPVLVLVLAGAGWCCYAGLQILCLEMCEFRYHVMQDPPVWHNMSINGTTTTTIGILPAGVCDMALLGVLGKQD